MKLKTIIVEDEIIGQEVLSAILRDYCSEMVEVVDKVKSVDDAINSIKKNSPQLVFLDINLCGNENGAFDILQAFSEIDFSIVFTTSSKLSDSILRAFNKHGAKKYLLKPLCIDEVIDSVAVAINEIKTKALESQFHQIKEIITSLPLSTNNNRLRLPVRGGFRCLNSDDIIMFRSAANNTLIFITTGAPIKSTKSLKYFEMELPYPQFLKTSRFHIVNNSHVKNYNEVGKTIFLSNNCEAALSDKFRDNFFKHMKNRKP